MNCGGPKPTSCATEFMNCGSVFEECITGFCTFSMGRLRQWSRTGLVKERVVPPKEIDHAVERKKRFEANPQRHTYQEV